MTCRVWNRDFVWPTNLCFCFGRQECFHINSYLKFVGCLFTGLQNRSFVLFFVICRPLIRTLHAYEVLWHRCHLILLWQQLPLTALRQCCHFTILVLQQQWAHFVEQWFSSTRVSLTICSKFHYHFKGGFYVGRRCLENSALSDFSLVLPANWFPWNVQQW